MLSASGSTLKFLAASTSRRREALPPHACVRDSLLYMRERVWPGFRRPNSGVSRCRLR